LVHVLTEDIAKSVACSSELELENFNTFALLSISAFRNKDIKHLGKKAEEVSQVSGPICLKHRLDGGKQLIKVKKRLNSIFRKHLEDELKHGLCVVIGRKNRMQLVNFESDHVVLIHAYDGLCSPERELSFAS
jgi:hypothetical protein